MACTNITTGGSVSLVAGSLGSSFCHKSWQKTYEDFINATSSSFTGGALFSAGDSAPATNHVWFKQQTDPDCSALGWHYYKDAAWTPVPVPATALPSGVVAASTKGSASANAVVTVDTYGRVTSLTEVAPTAESTDGHAKAWCKFSSDTSGSSFIGNQHNIASCSRTGVGTFTISTTTAANFSSVCIAIASHPGFADETQPAGSYTGADHVRILSSSVNSDNSGTATIELPRMVAGTEQTDDGDVHWDNDKGEAPTGGVGIVFFGN